MSASPPWYRRRRWSLGVVLLVIVLLAAAYQWASGRPSGAQVGSCTIVSSPDPGHRSDCRGADLAGRDLAGRDLRLADLHGADLRGADLKGTILYGADLTDTDLRGADLSETDLTDADMTDSTLRGTRFTRASVYGLNINGTALAAESRSVWTTGTAPVLLTWSSRTMPGITSNNCADREGLFTPGQNAVTCTVTTAALYGGQLQYGLQMEVKRPPTISAPASTSLRVGKPADVAVTASSPWPTVVTTLKGKLPRGVTYDPVAGRLVGTPTASSVGDYSVRIVAQNGRTVRQPLSISVTR